MILLGIVELRPRAVTFIQTLKKQRGGDTEHGVRGGCGRIALGFLVEVESLIVLCLIVGSVKGIMGFPDFLLATE